MNHCHKCDMGLCRLRFGSMAVQSHIPRLVLLWAPTNSWVADLWLTFAVSQLGGMFDHLGHFIANVVWVPAAFIHYWWENKCLFRVDAAATQLNHPLWWDTFTKCLVIHVYTGALGLQTQQSYNRWSFLYVCFVTVKNDGFPAQPITKLLGSTCLLPWQLPVNILGEFSLTRESTTSCYTEIDWTFL